MRALAAWLPLFVLVFGGYGLASHLSLSEEPQRVLVVVDSSFPMEEVWPRVPGELDGLDGARYTEYALATEKGLIHSWQDQLTLGSVVPFAPCDLSTVTAYPEAGQADDVVLLTTSASCPTDGLPGDWEVVLLDS